MTPKEDISIIVSRLCIFKEFSSSILCLSSEKSNLVEKNVFLVFF